MFRQIIGNVNRTNDQPWANLTVFFVRDKGNFTADTQYPPDTTSCKVDQDGNLVGCNLWVNETGEKITYYTAIVGKDRFKISVPVGTTPIELSTLRAGSDPVETYPTSIINYVDQKFAESGNDSIKLPFTQSNLNSEGEITLNHNLNNTPLIQILDNGKVIIPDEIIHLNTNSCKIILKSYMPIQNNWLIVAR